MKAAINVLREQLEHFYLIHRLSLFELKSNNNNNYLGMAWEILNPTIQILIYWFVFGSLRNRAPVDLDGKEIPFAAFLMVGFIVWNFFYQGTIQGSKSVYTRLAILSKMNFPISVIPTYVIFANFYVHVVMLFLVIVIVNFMGFFINIYYLQLLYFIFSLFCLLFAISLTTSTISTIIRDFHMLLNSVLRMLLYFTPVLWPLSTLASNKYIVLIIKLNPLYYIVEGYRAALFGTGWYFIEHWKYTVYFWALVLLLYLIGSRIHVKFRAQLIDYL